MKRAVLIAAVLLGTLAGLAMCGGTTGREGLVTPGGPEEAGLTVDAGQVEEATVSAMYQDAYDVTITYADRELPALEAGASSDAAPRNEAAAVPCTQGGQTGCIACNGRSLAACGGDCHDKVTGVCTATEALVVQRDIDKGLYSVVDGGWTGTTTPDGGPDGGSVEAVHAVGIPNLAAVSPVNTDDAGDAAVAVEAGPALPASCYACLVNQRGLDSIYHRNQECEDLDPLGVVKGVPYVQACLKVLACALGQPVTGSSPWASCADSPARWGNCYCGAAEPDVASCQAAMPPSAGNTSGGPGVASPNGACVQDIVDGVGDTLTTPPAQVLTDIGVRTSPTGRALEVLDIASLGGSSPLCPQCYH